MYMHNRPMLFLMHYRWTVHRGQITTSQRVSAVGSVDRKGLTAVRLGVRLEEGQYRTSVTPATALSELASEMHVLYNVQCTCNVHSYWCDEVLVNALQHGLLWRCYYLGPSLLSLPIIIHVHCVQSLSKP